MLNRPLLKGYSHLISTIVYILIYPDLQSLVPPDLKLPFTIYTISIIGNFACSTFLHIINWPKHLEIYVKRLDHIMIFIMISSTYYAGISTIMYDINPIIIYIVLIGTIIGIITRIFFTNAPKIFISLPYFLIGWSIILDPYIIFKMVDRVPEGSLIALLGGLSYSLGAVIYTFEYPKLYPKYIGYHELFHIFTIIGTTMFAICLFGYGIPYHQQHIN